MRISSPAFTDHGNVPGKYPCDGQNVNPPLLFEEVPANAKILALVVDDLDSPSGTWTHSTVLNIYPNPTGNLLNVVLNEKEHYQLTIVTIDGKWLESKTIIGNTTVDVSKYASGMYFITATNNEGTMYQSKFVKE